MFALFHSHRHAAEIKCIDKLFPGYQKILNMYIKHIDCNNPDNDLEVDKAKQSPFPMFFSVA